jgi:hypothetical protein
MELSFFLETEFDTCALGIRSRHFGTVGTVNALVQLLTNVKPPRSTALAGVSKESSRIVVAFLDSGDLPAMIGLGGSCEGTKTS